jgi:hypothetical protein
VSLRDAIQSDPASVFLNTDDFAETITYHPRTYRPSDTRTPRSIVAVVIREQMQQVSEDGGETITPVFEVHVANDPATGISGTELDLGGDQLAIPIRDGMEPVRRSIVRLMTQDHAMLVLECR